MLMSNSTPPPSKRHKCCVALLAVVTALATTVPAVAADAFYMSRMRDGRLALERGQPKEAIVELQIACFGLLEEPPVLAECLTWLAIANKNAGNENGFSNAFDRLLDVEERFGAYQAADLQEATRTAIETAIKQRVPMSFLASTKGFAHLATEPEEQVAEKPKRRSRKKKGRDANPEPQAIEALIKVASNEDPGSAASTQDTTSVAMGSEPPPLTDTSPTEAIDPAQEDVIATADLADPPTETKKERRRRERLERTERKASERAEKQAADQQAHAVEVAEARAEDDRLSQDAKPSEDTSITTDVSKVEAGSADVAAPAIADLQPNSSTTLPPTGLTADQRTVIANARRVLVEADTREEIATTLAVLRTIADEQPTESEVQHLTARLAYRGSQWTDTVTYVERGGDPSRDPELLFYYAIALFETGDQDRAANALSRALPALQRNNWVDGWVQKILGAG